METRIMLNLVALYCMSRNKYVRRRRKQMIVAKLMDAVVTGFAFVAFIALLMMIYMIMSIDL
jgi:hypothetical protein